MTHIVSTILKGIEPLYPLRQRSVLTVTLKDQKKRELIVIKARSIVKVN